MLDASALFVGVIDLSRAIQSIFFSRTLQKQGVEAQLVILARGTSSNSRKCHAAAICS
jgi:hypothetical protein